MGHRQWKATACPGSVYPYVESYRDTHSAPPPAISGMVYYITTYNANCREGTGTQYPIALNGTAITPKGVTFGVDAVVQGTPYNGDPYWVHRADGVGFYHNSVVKPC